MANKRVEFISRTGSSKSTVRRIEVQIGTGKKAVRTMLSTPITKVVSGVAFRLGGKHIPVEQYHFEVGKQKVQRFADATALVLKRHFVVMDDEAVAQSQDYVQRAFAILSGKEVLRMAVEPEVKGEIREKTPVLAE